MKTFIEMLINLIHKIHLKEFTMFLFFLLFWYIALPNWVIEILLSKTPRYFPDWLTLVEPTILCLSLICLLAIEPFLNKFKKIKVRYKVKRVLRDLSESEKDLLIKILTSPQYYLLVKELNTEIQSLWAKGLVTMNTQPNLSGYVFTPPNLFVFRICCQELFIR